jgi:hypothetical protein
MSDGPGTGRQRARHALPFATLTSLACLLRGVPLFFRPAPRTALRVLCIVALDAVHRLRHSRPLPRMRISELATFLDFQACTNAAWDHKPLCAAEYQAIRERLEQAGLELWIQEYLIHLRELERGRPSTGGDRRRFDEVRSYREAVARMSLAAVAAIALNAKCLNDVLRATRRDSDLETLFRIVMQCQIIDDDLDYAEDASAGLPSFLTASASLPQAVRLTAKAARSYATASECSSDDCVFPLRAALCAVTVVTQFVVWVARLKLSSRKPAGALLQKGEVLTAPTPSCRSARP